MLAALARAIRAWAVFIFFLPLGLALFAAATLRLARARGLRALCRGWAARAPNGAAAREAAFGARRVVAANGVQFSVLEAGDASQPLLLCLHGFPESAYAWRWWLRAFSGAFHVVAVDQRGYGATRAPRARCGSSAPLAVRHLVADVEALAAALGHAGEKVTLAAHDWGGMVAWCAAARLEARGLLARLIIVNIPHPAAFFANLGLAQAIRSLYIVFFHLPWAPEWLLSRDDGRALEQMFLGGHMGVRRRAGATALARADVDVFKAALACPGALTAALGWYRQIFAATHDDFAALAPSAARPLRTPVLILWGTADAALGEELLRGTGAYCADLTVRRLEGCSHWAQQDFVEECVAEAARFCGVAARPLGVAPPAQ